MKDPIFLSSPIYPPLLPSKSSLSTNRGDQIIPLFSHDRFIFKAHLTSPYMHPTDYTFRLYDKNQDFFTSIASKIMSLYQYWLDNGVKNFSLPFSFLRPSIYNIKTDENDPSFLSVAQKVTHQQPYTKFLQHTKPQNYIFVSYKYTSPFTMTNLYKIDHSRIDHITSFLRNYDPIKEYFCLLSHNDTSRPLIVPQEYLLHLDDFLLPCDIPNTIVQPPTVIKNLVFSPHDDKDLITLLFQNNHIPITNCSLFLLKFFPIWYKPETYLNTNLLLLNIPSPICTTSDKLSSILNNRTLRDITQLLDPFKRNPSACLSPLSYISYTVMTEHTNSYNPLT